jgi:hypothetical protein
MLRVDLSFGRWTVVPADAQVPKQCHTITRTERSTSKGDKYRGNIGTTKQEGKEGRKEEETEERYPVTLPTPEEAHLFALRLITLRLGYKML